MILNLLKKMARKAVHEISASLIKNAQGETIGFRGIARDVTERKQTEEKLLLTLESLRKAVGTTIQVLVSALEAREIPIQPVTSPSC